MILLVNGPNLNLLGEREPAVYGRETLVEVERMVAEVCAGYGVQVKALQSNWEGALIDFLQEHRREAQGVILNPGALTHTSRALADCLKALNCPTIEVHVSNVHARERWRRKSVVAPVAQGQIAGLGISGYYYAALHLCAQLAARAGQMSGSGSKENVRTGSPPESRRVGDVRTARPEAASEPGSPVLVKADVLEPEPSEEPAPDSMARGDYEPL
ncbi:MAG TPA: type II 3-dehydroquinate dehydratase [Anaeromyxobacteraceae bacterium]|nr:type II 3-dehydroquinate dehydratase [Anaeromyxobacteraceae bacterium]